jgi:hypothetical protein
MSVRKEGFATGAGFCFYGCWRACRGSRGQVGAEDGIVVTFGNIIAVVIAPGRPVQQCRSAG